jgi:hypothetical protein
MRMTNRVLWLLLTLALAVPIAAVPGTAFAQSAGDDQYVDPFQDDNSDKQGNSENQGGGNDTPPAAEQPTAQAPAETSVPAESSATEGAAASGSTLPRTGLPAGELALIGVVLLSGGFALRRAWPLPE